MELSVKDLAVFLLKPEKEIIALVKNKNIPFDVIRDKVCFNKQQIIAWAIENSVPVNLTGSMKMTEYSIGSMVPLLSEKSFYRDVNLSEKSYLDEMVNIAEFPAGTDKKVVVQLLKAREGLMSTAIGHGISLPHPRVPLIIAKDRPLIMFFFPEKYLKLKAVDNQPVHTIILMMSQTIKQHLGMLAHINLLLSHESFRVALKQRAVFMDIVNVINEIEGRRAK
ncbi:MAG: hypothetical protein CVV21_00560 [Candidatus Goldiibacteriota bacterium HGW-Goldbacteria-1]|jgi:PTS system nitrogen regulatory IIA component|nr:MAG: hypothetical protein CVV21_00560 [Candidatus Goldiibacteriota bacterium HGW-Goldbacteria-1]